MYYASFKMIKDKWETMELKMMTIKGLFDDLKQRTGMRLTSRNGTRKEDSLKESKSVL